LAADVIEKSFESFVFGQSEGGRGDVGSRPESGGIRPVLDVCGAVCVVRLEGRAVESVAELGLVVVVVVAVEAVEVDLGVHGGDERGGEGEEDDEEAQGLDHLLCCFCADVLWCENEEQKNESS